MNRRSVLRVFGASAAVAGLQAALLPESDLLQSRASGAMVNGDNGEKHRLTGRLLLPRELNRELAQIRASGDANVLSRFVDARGLTWRGDAAYAIEGIRDESESLGAITIVPIEGSGGAGGAFLRRRTPRSDDQALATWDAGRRTVEVFQTDGGAAVRRAVVELKADGGALIHWSNGQDQVVPPRPTGGRAGLSAPLADGCVVQTICQWALTWICRAVVTVVGVVVCFVVLDLTGAGVIACALVFLFIEGVVCDNVPEWLCQAVCF